MEASKKKRRTRKSVRSPFEVEGEGGFRIEAFDFIFPLIQRDAFCVGLTPGDRANETFVCLLEVSLIK